MNGVLEKAGEQALDYNPCLTAVRRLHDYLSRELSPHDAAALEGHLAECQGCYARFHFEETLHRAIRERVGEVHAPPTLHAHVLGRLHALEAAGELAPESHHPPDGEPTAADAVNSTE